MSLQQILALSSTTTPALVSGSFGSDPNVGDGHGWGAVPKTKIRISATRANGSAMTGVKFEVRGRWTTSSTWRVLPTYEITDTAQTHAVEYSLAVANNSTADTILVVPDGDAALLLEVRAKSVGADAGAGDSCAAWLDV